MRAATMMSCFWEADMSTSLQAWGSGDRVMHLDTNESSGADEWFGGVLDACRDGAFAEDDYNFLHGYPTRCRVQFWYHRRKEKSFVHDDVSCVYEAYDIRSTWERPPVGGKPECADCWRERKRRARVLRLDAHEAEESARLADARLLEEGKHASPSSTRAQCWGRSTHSWSPGLAGRRRARRLAPGAGARDA